MLVFYFRNISIQIISLLLISSCNGLGVAKFESNSNGTESSNDLVFSGITSVTNTTDSTAKINWTHNPSALAYEIYKIVSGNPVYITTTSSPASSTVLTGLTPNSNYVFRVKAVDATGKNDANTVTQSITTNAAPDRPSYLTLTDPTVNHSFDATPTIEIGGVKSGDIVKLYQNSTCTSIVESITASGSSVTITTPTLSSGTYTFYATSSNSTTSSTCSTASVTYTLDACPTGYVEAPANTTLGVNAFCVMKYEAKDVGGVPTSQPTSSPWRNVTQIAAKTACTVLGSNYDLISNQEWITIARDIENVASNWSSNTVGVGMLPMGHTDSSPDNPLEVSNINDPYIGTSNNSSQGTGSGWEQKRTLTMSNGNVIWDFPGNVWEWVDWSLSSGLQSGPTNCSSSWEELTNISCAGLNVADYQPNHPTYNSSQGLGQIYGGGGGDALRGGNWKNGSVAGLFSLNLSRSSGTYDDVGFRCVYRP